MERRFGAASRAELNLGLRWFPIVGVVAILQQFTELMRAESRGDTVWRPPSPESRVGSLRVNESARWHTFYCVHSSIATIQYHLGSVDIAGCRTHAHVEESRACCCYFWLPSSSGARPAISQNFLSGPARLHQALNAIAPQCPHTLVVPSVRPNHDEQCGDNGHHAPWCYAYSG